MRRGQAVAALGVAAAATVLALAAGGRLGDGKGSLPPAQPLSLSTSLDPRSLRFGDPLEARLELVLDPSRVEPASVRVVPRFRPYRVLGLIGEKRERGGALLLLYRYALECLSPDCLPAAGQAERRLTPALVSYRLRSGRRETVTVDWPSIQLSSHLSDADRAAPGARLRVDAPLPRVSYGVDPEALRYGLLGGSALLALAAGAFAWLAAAGRRRPAPAAGAEPAFLPLDRALLLAREQARDGSPPGRRRALERLARELAASGRSDLAEEAGRLAWSPPAPTREVLRAFVEGVAGAVEREEAG